MGMKIDEYINRVLRKFWPEDKQGDRKVWFHSQNLNEDRNGDPKGPPTHGRASLNVSGLAFRVEWLLNGFRRNLFSVRAESCGEDGGLSVSGGLWPVTTYWHLPMPFKFWKKIRYSDRNFLQVYLTNPADLDTPGEMTLHWQFGGSTMSWDSATPKWKHGSFHITDFVFGKREYKEGTPEIHKVKIPMPEGAYDATVELRNDRWTRARGKTLELRRASVNVDIGIPFPGKGENSWDCGDDASFGLSCTADTVEEAIGKQVQSVLRNRRRYGSLMMEYPSPAERRIEVERLRREAARERADLIAQAAEAAKNVKPGEEPKA